MSIQTVAVFHCKNNGGAAWSCAEGIVSTLQALNYRVIDCGHPNTVAFPIEDLRQADLIIMSAVEWFDRILIERYGAAWGDLKMPKAAWYAESAHRDDQNFPFERCRPLADRHYFPAEQDAVEFDGVWLPFGVDTDVFKPASVEKRYEAAFRGSLYPKRQEYIKRIGYPLEFPPPATAHDRLRSAEALAAAYGSIRVFVNLPSYSRLLVTKVIEVMACRTMLITPAVDHPSGLRNMAVFEDGKHLAYYDPDRPQDIGGLIEKYLRDPDELDAVAEAGWREVTRAHTLRQRVEKIISDAQGSAGGA